MDAKDVCLQVGPGKINAECWDIGDTANVATVAGGVTANATLAFQQHSWLACTASRWD